MEDTEFPGRPGWSAPQTAEDDYCCVGLARSLDTDHLRCLLGQVNKQPIRMIGL
jgi:hypothetical protein